MSLLLIQKTMVGEPVAIHAEGGETAVFPGRERLLPLGKAIVATKGTSVPWDVFVEQKKDSANHKLWWDSVDTDASLQEALTTAHEAYEPL